MKNLSLILNVVLLIALAVLYFLHFSSQRPGNDEEQEAGSSPFPVNIAFINSDTLLQNYDFFKAAAEQLEKKKDDLQAEYDNRARGLESEIANFQQNARNMTIAQARAVEEDLVKKQQNLLRYQESLAQSLAQEESKVNNQLYDKVAEFLKGYGQKNNYQLVLTYQKGSGVLYANDSLNITKEVIDGLNSAYQKEHQQADSLAAN